MEANAGNVSQVASAITQIKAFFKLVRLGNLLMIGLTQYFLKYCIIHKVFYQHGLDHAVDDVLFFLLVLSTVLIAAGGYIINDYFDLKTDLINHPQTVVVDTVIKRRWAIIFHLVFTFAGVVLGMYTALKTGYLRLAIFHFAAATLLWFYSTHFKRQLLTGNLTVAILTAAVTFMPFIYELGVMQKLQPGFLVHYREAVLSSFKYIWIYATFAFITTLSREIIKDLEDYEGDIATGCNTLPISWGTGAARLTSFFLIVITVLLLCFAVYNTIRWQRPVQVFPIIYIVAALVIPLCLLAIYVFGAQSSLQWHRASIALKVIMLAGLCYSLVFYYS